MSNSDDEIYNSHAEVLEAFARELDISEAQYQKAVERYQSIGNWLDRDNSTLKKFSPQIFPQGSFLLGTITKPVGDADEYDIDLVCTLKNASKADFTMEELKSAVGKEIAGYAEANSMKLAPVEGRRCWTLEYSDGVKFHMDVLPAIPNEKAYRVLMEKSGRTDLAYDAEITKDAIAITDAKHPAYTIPTEDWPVSNPKGYAKWFNSRQEVAIRMRKQALMEHEGIYASVDEVPDHRIKTPLQQAIQLLKRHRDSLFQSDAEHKPISIIISTLAAHAYQGEGNTRDALRTILTYMHTYIGEKNGVKVISNPVNPDENFADKWPDNPKKEKNFYSWLEQARKDFSSYIAGSRFDAIPAELRFAMSETTSNKVEKRISHSGLSGVSRVSVATAEAKRIQHQGASSKPWLSK